ncbi:MAG: GNAT family N-acetyltransferase [Deinococcales bacterium]
MSGAQRGILLRPFDPDRDVPDVVALVNEAARAQGGPVTDEAEQRHILELPDHEPRRDRWMAVDARGRPVGFAGVWKAGATPYGELFWAVRPDEVGRRAQGPLLRQALRRTRELGAEALLTYLPPSDHASIDFFVDSGFEAVDGYRRLTLGLETLPSPPVWPDGFRLRLYAEVDRLDVLTQAMNDCFAGLWGHKVVTAETARTVLEASPPDGILLLFDGRAEVAGCSPRPPSRATKRSASSGRRNCAGSYGGSLARRRNERRAGGPAGCDPGPSVAVPRLES